MQNPSLLKSSDSHHLYFTDNTFVIRISIMELWKFFIEVLVSQDSIKISINPLQKYRMIMREETQYWCGTEYYHIMEIPLWHKHHPQRGHLMEKEILLPLFRWCVVTLTLLSFKGKLCRKKIVFCLSHSSQNERKWKKFTTECKKIFI